MLTKRIIIQALTGGVMFLIFKLILERSTSVETLMNQGLYALAFTVFYAVYLVIRNRFSKKSET
jgi:hypothetical protein